MKNVIYQIRNVLDGHYYIGSTVDSRKRFWAHRKALRAGTHDCRHLQRAWLKYGEDVFKFEVTQVLAGKEALYPAEQMLLNEHFGKPYCYNAAAHADSPMRDATPEMRALLSQKTKAWLERDGHPRAGYMCTPEEVAHMKVSRVHNPSGAAHYRFGQTLSPEVREKIGAAQRGVKKAPRTFTEDGLRRAQENMQRNAREQLPAAFQEVFAKFPSEVQERYDFTNAVYTGALVRIEGCQCPQHGLFSQYAAQFRKGRGCPECGAEQRAASKKAQMKEAWADPAEREKMLAARKKA
jgi:group I intron endonuclease